MPRSLIVVLSILAAIGAALTILRREEHGAGVNPCLMDVGPKIRLVYMVRGPAAKGVQANGCALCDADNADQWNTLYRVFGGREDIEFVVIRPERSARPDDRTLRCDRSIVRGDGAGDEDQIILCDRGLVRLDHRGVIDMAFVREAYEFLTKPAPYGL